MGAGVPVGKLPPPIVVFLVDRSGTDISSIDVKHSTHKSVKVFLKACAKEGLIKLKETKGDVVITGIVSISSCLSGP